MPEWATLDPLARKWWAWAWKLPIARLWAEHEIPMVVRRAQLEATWQQTADPKVLGEMRFIEAALLMTAKARKEARVRFAEQEDAVTAPVPIADDLAERRARIARAKRAS